jgi:hypothetical protein
MTDYEDSVMAGAVDRYYGAVLIDMTTGHLQLPRAPFSTGTIPVTGAKRIRR